MALIDCPEYGCGHKVSTSANSCPGCGHDIQKYLSNNPVIQCPRCQTSSRVSNPDPKHAPKKVKMLSFWQFYPFQIPNISQGWRCKHCGKGSNACWYY
jgi:DNA-directed RNA polymerase subunit RPC12/RpoP